MFVRVRFVGSSVIVVDDAGRSSGRTRNVNARSGQHADQAIDADEEALQTALALSTSLLPAAQTDSLHPDPLQLSQGDWCVPDKATNATKDYSPASDRLWHKDKRDNDI